MIRPGNLWQLFKKARLTVPPVAIVHQKTSESGAIAMTPKLGIVWGINLRVSPFLLLVPRLWLGTNWCGGSCLLSSQTKEAFPRGGA